MDDRYLDILVEGERIPSDDEDYFRARPPRLDAPHSTPHSRSNSFKNRPRPKLILDIKAAQRPRTNSLPNAYLPLPDPFYLPRGDGIKRVRSFKTTSKGLINHGDSFKMSTNSLMSSGSAASLNDTSGNRSPRRTSCPASHDGSVEDTSSLTSQLDLYRVLLMGAPGVGKSALARQFMTSEYKGTYDSTTPEIIEPERNVNVLLDGKESILHFLDEEQLTLLSLLPSTAEIIEPERNVNVLLDGKESILHFLDEEQHPNFEAEDLPIDAYVVIFSVSDSATYNAAVHSIRTLREEHRTNKAIILVGNKIDLARQRRVAKHDALKIAKKYDCRYTETSAALNHHVDELLVGILSQIREQISPSASASLAPHSDSKHRSRSKSPGKAITDFLGKIFGGDKKAKSCETLFVK
ncbi:GTP-binding protein rad [Plakobranchus ocellatus]|uniref:GTP-binding protein rad n=1 Tax=Plakobranchus ocellatus TaxID=259542 RepID=A0AAV4C730_9GAST|nr:GTP-binding protein rad [Plakobranchus ocellatus]